MNSYIIKSDFSSDDFLIRSYSYLLHYFTLHYKIYLKKYSSKEKIPLTIHPHQLRPIIQSFNVPKQRHFRWTFRFFPSWGRARVFVISFTPETVGKSATKWIHRPDEDAGPFRKSDVEGVYSAVIFTSRRDTPSLVSLSFSPFIFHLSLSLYVELSSQRTLEIRDAEGVAEPPRAGRKPTLNLARCRAATGPEPWPVRYSC